MKPKILYIVTQAEFGGAQRYVYDLATNLSYPSPNLAILRSLESQATGGEGDIGFEIVVAIGEIGDARNPRVSEANPAYAGTPRQDDLASRLEARGIRVIRLKHLVREIVIWNDLRAVCEIRKLIKKERPDIVHLNSTKAGFVGSLAVWLSQLKLGNTYNILPGFSRPKNLRLIYTIHGWIFNEPLSAWRKKLYLCLEKISARICDALVVLSQSELQTGIDKKIAPSKKFKLIPHGIAPPDFLPREIARETLLQNPPPSPFIEGGGFIIGTIANFYPTKGLPYLIEAAAKLKIKHDFQIVIVGDGIERAYLESLILKYNLEENIILAGQIPDAAKYLKAFDIFVLPSVKEGLPYAILEAMAAGLPIVATTVGGIPEMIRSGHDGLLVAPKNPEELAGAIEKLIDQPELRELLGKNALASRQQKFGINEMLKKTEQLYF